MRLFRASSVPVTPGAVAAAVVLALAGLARPAAGAQVNYGSFSGTNVNYVNVSEDSGADPLPLFGSPTLSGNTIDFNPLGFDAASSNGGSTIVDSNLVFSVAAKSGSRISSLTLTETGDTTLAGTVALGSVGTATAVFASGVLDIHEVNFAGINNITVPFSLTFNPSGGTWFLGTDGGGGPVFHTQWTGSISLNIDAILIANGFSIPPGNIDPDGGATRISIDMDNTLTAVSQLGTSAIIGKKDFGALTVSTNVPNEPGGSPELPEPAAAIAVALVPLLARRRVRPLPVAAAE